ncbi:Druantia anti-phage system protein DruA [Candidatus Kuenenia stuttgartensis]|uniref:Druantia anti-phage system protein DruA n=1 Tax=Kuenenia stuttgartiensis TaxID=174633 RepID=UPI00146E1C02
MLSITVRIIAPTVRVKCLASHVLAKCQTRLVDDWERVYKYRPVLLETYVERGRFSGSCYRAANWKYVGGTEGRGRKGTGATVKDVYVMRCKRNGRRCVVLCGRWQSTCRQRVAQKEPRDWIEAELRNKIGRCTIDLKTFRNDRYVL